MYKRLAIGLFLLAASPSWLVAQPSPTVAECRDAMAAIQTADELERMTPERKVAERRRLEQTLVILRGCMRAEAAEAIKKAQATVNSAIADCERRGQPKIGMTANELIETCWRKPTRIVKTTTAAGTEESYFYGSSRLVTIVNGRVTSIVESR